MKKLLKFVIILIVLIVVLCVALYFLATNSFVIKHAILPIAGNQLGAKISVEKIVISPIKGDYIVRDLKVNAPEKYSVSIGDFNCNLSLFELLGGTLKIGHLNLIDPDIKFIQRVSTTKEKAEVAEAQPAQKGKTTQKPLILDINKVKIKNFNLEYVVKRATEAKSSITEIKNFNLSIPQLKTGTKGEIYCSGLFRVGSEAKEHKLTGLFSGQLLTKLSSTSMPELADLKSKIKFAHVETPINLKFVSKENQELNTQPFSMDLNITNLPLLPFFKAFLEGSLSGSKGNVEDFSIDMNGADLNNIDINNNVKGQLKTNITGLCLPMVLAKYDITKLIFLPIEVLANLNQYTKSKAVPSQFNNVFKSANQVTSGLTEMQFDNTDADISIDNGVVNIKQFQMKGGEVSAVRSIALQGTVDLKDKIDVKAETNILGLTLPMRIGGTLEKPKPDLGLLLPGAIIDTAKDIITTGGKSGEDIVKNGQKVIEQVIKLPKAKSPSEKESATKKVIDGASKLLNNFLK